MIEFTDLALTLPELIAQLCQLEVRLELRIGDLPASQIIREATRRLELHRGEIDEMRQIITGLEAKLGYASNKSLIGLDTL